MVTISASEPTGLLVKPGCSGETARGRTLPGDNRPDWRIGRDSSGWRSVSAWGARLRSYRRGFMAA